MKLEKDCPWCGSKEFAKIEPVWVEVSSPAKKGMGNTTKVPFVMVVCTGCSATQLFAKSGSLLDDFKHTPLAVEG